MAKSEARYVGAYLVRGSKELLEALITKLETDGITRRGSPDLFAKAYRSFGVDDAADVRARVRTKPVEDAQRVFILAVPSMTTEAQNALLKTLEEPAADAVLFLIAPSPDMLLPTIRSRVQMLQIQGGERANVVDVDEFLKAAKSERLEMLKPLYEHEDEGRDIGSVLGFMQSLEERLAAAKKTPEVLQGIHALYRARKFATDKGSLLKALLENVALLTPKL